MNTTSPAVAIGAHHGAVRTALVIDAGLWLAVGAASRNRGLYSDGDGWEGTYAVFSVLLLIAAAVAALAVTAYTSPPGQPSRSRVAAVVLVILATVSTVVAWAFPLWAVLLAFGFAALAATGPSRTRNASWLGAALLSGLAVAIVGLLAEIGPAGSHNDYPEAQGWGVTVGCVLAAAVLVLLSRRAAEPR
jgi:hypothetical protein